jgi:cytochrome P450
MAAATAPPSRIYWLSPGPEIHQEHLEPGERYEEVARVTRQFLALPKRRAEELASHCFARVLGSMGVQRRPRLVRLRDPMMQVWAEFYYQLVFGEHSPPTARALIVANADDVVTALKCCGLRHMKRRRRLTEFLLTKVKADQLAHPLPAVLSAEEQALYLQGVFFNTAIVQMSEAMAHLIMVLAQHQHIQERLVAEIEDDRFFDRIINETLWQYPLFGIAHRITSEDIAVNDHTTISKGSVLCFNYPDYHRIGFDDPDRFDPDRWEKLSGREATYIPFGVTANRPCPAQALALVTMRAAGREFIRRFACYSSAAHTRSIPNRGPCLLVSRAHGCNPLVRHALLFFMAVRDRWEDVWRSMVQLVLGTYMVWHARRLRLCQRYFARERCPVGGRLLPG